MVRGIDKFREFFTGYEGNYVIIGWLPCLLLPTPTKFLIRLNKMLTGFAWLSKKKCQTLIFSNRQDLKAFPENSYWNNLKPIS